MIAFGGNNTSGPIDVATAQTAHGGTGRLDFESETFVMQAGAVRENPASGPDGMGVQTGIAYTLEARAEVQMVAHAAPICFDETQVTSAQSRSNPQPGGPSHALAKGARPPTIAFNWNAQPDQMNFSPETTPTLSCSQGAAAMVGWRVRRLTPRECERLQGFPDDYTAIIHRKKPAADGPRYKALGNSMAVNVMRWIGMRIQQCEGVPDAKA